jgi:hypothetical protein
VLLSSLGSGFGELTLPPVRDWIDSKLGWRGGSSGAVLFVDGERPSCPPLPDSDSDSTVRSPRSEEQKQHLGSVMEEEVQIPLDRQQARLAWGQFRSRIVRRRREAVLSPSSRRVFDSPQPSLRGAEATPRFGDGGGGADPPPPALPPRQSEPYQLRQSGTGSTASSVGVGAVPEPYCSSTERVRSPRSEEQKQHLGSVMEEEVQIPLLLHCHPVTATVSTPPVRDWIDSKLGWRGGSSGAVLFVDGERPSEGPVRHGCACCCPLSAQVSES